MQNKEVYSLRHIIRYRIILRLNHHNLDKAVFFMEKDVFSRTKRSNHPSRSMVSHLSVGTRIPTSHGNEEDARPFLECNQARGIDAQVWVKQMEEICRKVFKVEKTGVPIDSDWAQDLSLEWIQLFAHYLNSEVSRSFVEKNMRMIDRKRDHLLIQQLDRHLSSVHVSFLAQMRTYSFISKAIEWNLQHGCLSR